MNVIDVYVIILGLIFGSFYNVVALRSLKGESLLFPSSRCPHCQHPLAFLDLVPLFSYLFLRGRCRYCQTRISPLYLLGEVVTSFSFLLTYKVLGLSLELIPAFVLLTLLILSVLTDSREQLILDKLTFPLLAVLLCLRIFIAEEPVWFYLIGGFSAFLLLTAVAFLSKGGIGGGDIKLYTAIGIAIGPWLTLLSLGIASFFGSLIGLVLIGMGKMDRKQPIPFAPYIYAGTMVAYLFGEQLWNWYILNLLR